MRQSKLFGKTRQDVSQDEKSINAQILTRAGFIDKQMAGVYAYLPLGLRTYRKIERVIREEMNKIGGQELLMSALQSKELWDKSGRWEKMEPIMYQFKDHHGSEVGLAATHEEPITAMVAKQVNSYKDLPIYIYQIQTKFRDEKRAKSGVLRGREFQMKDLYSFHVDTDDLDKYYKIAHDAYLKIYDRLGLKAFSVEASGGDMSDQFSHEFMVETEAGEDKTILCRQCSWAQNVEISKIKNGDKCPNCGAKAIEAKTIEAGNIFRQGDMYSKPLGLNYVDAKGQKRPVILGSYGIGLSRIMGTIVEASHDKDGIIWTKSTTPYHVHLLNLSKNDKTADRVYDLLDKEGIEVLYDDRDISFGKKLKDADLIGICWQLVVSDRPRPGEVQAGRQDKLELIYRQDHKKEILDSQQALKKIKEFYK